MRITGYLADGGWATEVLVVIDDGQVSDGRDSYLAMGGNPELDQADRSKLLTAHYSLTERGNKAVALIINSVVEELQKPSDSADVDAEG